MDFFEKLLDSSPSFGQVWQDMQGGKYPIVAFGLSSVHRANMVYALQQKQGENMLVLTGDEREAIRMCENINAMAHREIAAVYQQKDYLFFDVEGAGREFEYNRLAVLGRLLKDEIKIVVSTAAAAAQYTLLPEDYNACCFALASGDEIDQQVLIDRLIKAGYVRRDQVDGPAQFAVRGGIIDVFPPQMQLPVRMEFWGDEIDTLATFDLLSQRRIDPVEKLIITPAREVRIADKQDFIAKLKKVKGLSDEVRTADIERVENDVEILSLDRYTTLCQNNGTLFDYFSGPIFSCELAQIREELTGYDRQMSDDIASLIEQGRLFAKCGNFGWERAQVMAWLQGHQTIFLETFSRSMGELVYRDMVHFNALTTSSWSGQLSLLREELQDYTQRGYCVMIMAGTEKSAKTLALDLVKDGYNARYTTSGKDLIARAVYVSEGSLTSGFEWPEQKVALISYHLADGNKKSTKKARKVRKKDVINSLEDISTGDYVVHVTHGIGRFDGVVQLTLQGVKKDYLKLSYAGKDVLFVPITQLDLVSKYIGNTEDKHIKLNKLYSAEWSKTKNRVYQSVKEMADELIKLYAKRSMAKGYAFSEDNEWQAEFEDRFAYQETEDQLRCIDEIKKDMCSARPMDRILCGDVGYGKTEVAMRAMFKCVLDGKQCAILVPTTILAYQHYQNILKRIGDFPVQVELMSRFRTPKQQKEIVKRLSTGEVDVVVGTHRLIQKDVQFKDLGLAIIDEEQRFGVAHKEKFKENFPGIDLLTLTATPIPRTLNMAMTGIRDISVIDEPPQNRHPVQTYVCEHDDNVIADAIKKELRRGGQVYYLYNRIDSIEQCCAKIREKVPGAMVDYAHGKMSERELSDKWAALLDGTLDVLVCTTIIETGVDVPNVNTLIIEDADRMGLSQLYQLRGRVGRSSRRAYAYFTFKRGKVLTEIADKRLAAIREFTNFGSGFKIAMRDLEIRGAGNLLGVQQHGHMDAVGYDMYLRLLNEAIAERQGKTDEQRVSECRVDIQVDAYIPQTYIESLQNRVDMYKKIATIESEKEAEDVVDEMIDRFGDPPGSVQGLVDVALLRNRAAALGISEIQQQDLVVTLKLDKLNTKKLGIVLEKAPKNVRFVATGTPEIKISLQKGQKPMVEISRLLAAIEQI